jgi:hypothetical protein
MADYSTNFKKHGAYAADQAMIAELFEVAETFMGEAPSIKVELEDEQEITSTAVKEVLDDVYVKNKYIKKVLIMGFATGRRRLITIRLQISEMAEWPLDVSVQGDREACVMVKERIESIIQGREQWFSKFMLPHKLGYVIAFVMGLPLAILGIVLGIHLVLRPDMVASDKIHPFIVLEWVGIWGVAFLLKRKMFPKLVFNIGKSENMDRSAHFWRQLVGLGIGIGLLVAVIGGLIVERIGK